MCSKVDYIASLLREYAENEYFPGNKRFLDLLAKKMYHTATFYGNHITLIAAALERIYYYIQKAGVPYGKIKGYPCSAQQQGVI